MVYNKNLNKNSRNKRKPFLSIIISANNDIKNLKLCLDAFTKTKVDLKNIEIVIVNNYFEDKQIDKSLNWLVEEYKNKFNQVILYQCNNYSTQAQLKNLGIDFSRGSWLFFMNSNEIPNPKFVKFLTTFRFNLQHGFYRVGVLNQNKKKIKIGKPKSKFYSSLSSTLIINEEFIETKKIRWESSLDGNETNLFLDKLYSTKNVNYAYIKNQYSVIHDFSLDHHNFKHVEEACGAALRQNANYFKQYIILMAFNYFSLVEIWTEQENQNLLKIKSIFNKAGITFFSYFSLGIKLFFKTIKFRWKILFA